MNDALPATASSAAARGRVDDIERVWLAVIAYFSILVVAALFSEAPARQGIDIVRQLTKFDSVQPITAGG